MKRRNNKFMCGIVGLSLSANSPHASPVIARMSDLIEHRGPDSEGHLVAGQGTAHVGFRRLAIRDLNSRADQPMVSASGRTAIVFNGEVYNSSQLADRYLPNLTLRTTGDTEVVLEVLERHGLGVLDQFNGMFAIAVVDIASGKITLARDRMGKKPLYLYADRDLVAFASELRALKPFGLRVNPENLHLFLHFGYFPSPYTHYRNTTQLCPGEIIELQHGRVLRRSRFHRFVEEAWATHDVDDDRVDELLRDATRLRMLSDVPLGAFLSGGIDSALVAAQLTKHERQLPPTFTIQLDDQRHNEADDAAATAAELGLPHLVIPIEEQDLPTLASEFHDCYEQPYADTSGLVTMLLCQAVKKHVTVALSGDGGDEFYGGYYRYRWFQLGLRAQQSPHALRRLLGYGLRHLEPRRGRRLETWLRARDPAELYCAILRNWTARPRLLAEECREVVRPLDLVREVFDEAPGDAMSRAACYDATYYIPDDLQVKLDRASMRVALEVRCPLLDYRVARLGAEYHTAYKYRHGLKTILKRRLAQYVSPGVLKRPKHGFSVPLGRWLRGPMRDMVQGLVDQRQTREIGWMDSNSVRTVWDEFSAGATQHAHVVWMLVSLLHHLADEPIEKTYADLLGSMKRAAA